MNKNLRTTIIVGGVVLAILIVLPLLWGGFAGWQGRSWSMMGPWMMGGFGWGWFMPVLMIVFWGLIIWGVVALIRGLSSPKHCDLPGTDPALAVLKRRYAKGEINREEYEEKKRDLV